MTYHELRNELHVGIVRPLGVDASAFVDHIRECLGPYGYGFEDIKRVKLSSLIGELLPPWHPELPSKEGTPFLYYSALMDGGDLVRGQYDDNILAVGAVASVAELKKSQAGGRKRCYIYDSLLHPSEVEYLRSSYGSRFFLVSLLDTEANLLQRVTTELRANGEGAPENRAIELVNRSRGSQREEATMLSYESTFYLADAFFEVDSWRFDSGTQQSENEVFAHFLRQLFGCPHGVPTPAELGMAHAFAAALGSSALSRRVGAAVVASDGGHVVSTGRNEVPRPGGGLYNGTEYLDCRDSSFVFLSDDHVHLSQDVVGGDSNDFIKLDILHDTLSLASEFGDFDAEEVFKAMVASGKAKSSAVFDIISYGRTVHAEMDAITSAARTGIPIGGATLYCTTFPCHECTRHIAASGLREVFFIEPYAKSRAGYLHSDSIELVGGPEGKTGDESVPQKVKFRRFVGIAPRRQDELFSFEDRKLDNTEDLGSYGSAISWEPGPDLIVRSSVGGSDTQIAAAAIVASSIEGAALQSWRDYLEGNQSLEETENLAEVMAEDDSESSL